MCHGIFCYGMCPDTYVLLHRICFLDQYHGDGEPVHSVIESLKSVPGVKGALLADDTGGVLASCLPDNFSMAVLNAIVAELNFNMPGFHQSTGGAKVFDLRFENGRVVLKPFGNCCLLVICEPVKNIQLLTISMNVAVSKIEKIIQNSPEPRKYISDKVVVAPAAPEEQAIPADKPIPRLHKPKLRSELLLERFQNEYSKP